MYKLISIFAVFTFLAALPLTLTACGGGEKAPKVETVSNESENQEKKADKPSKVEADDEEDDDMDEEKEKEAEETTEEDVDEFLKYAKEIIDDELVLPKEITQSAEEYMETYAEAKKWRGNYMIVTVNKKGKVTNVKFRTKTPTIEYEDINDAFEAAVYKAEPFRSPPVNDKGLFEFKVRLLGTKSYVTAYKLKM